MDEQSISDGIRALKEACNATHKGGPCAQVSCICGNTGSSAACGALGLIRDALRYDDAKTMELKEILLRYL